MDALLGVFMFAIGASVGSFVNVAADRLPVGQSIFRPPSTCSTCRTRLRPIDLIPVASYLWLRGSCRYCGTAIPARLPIVEAATGLLFTGVYLRYDLGADFVIVCGAIAVLLIVTLIDLDHGLILNLIVFPGVVAALILAPFWTEVGLTRPLLGSETVLASFLNSVLAGAGAFLFLLGIFLLFPQGMGAGDVKLAGLIGLLVGYPGVVVALWLAVVSGGLVGVLLLALRRKRRNVPTPRCGPAYRSCRSAVESGQGDGKGRKTASSDASAKG